MNQSNIRYVIVVAFVTAMGGFLLGFDGSVISGASPFYKDVFGLREDSFLFGFSVSCILWGGILGSLTAGAISDKIGRKPTLLITAILFIISAVASALASSIGIFIIGRIIGGIAVGIAILVAPVYIAEISPSKQRGWLVSFNQLLIVIGLSAAYYSNYFILQWVDDPQTNWRWMLGVEAIPAAMYFLLLLLIPESPRWLIMRGKEADGRKVLSRVYGQNAERAFENIQDSLLQNLKGNWKHHLRELFTPSMRKIMTIGIGLAIFQQVSGINAILYYAPMIFESTGGGRDAAFFQATVLGAVFVVMTLVSMGLIDRLGRKPLLYMGVSLMALSLLVTGINFLNATYELNPEAIQAKSTTVFEKQVWQHIKSADRYTYESMSVEGDVLTVSYKDYSSEEFSISAEPFNDFNNQRLTSKKTLEELAGNSFNSESDFKAAVGSTLKDANIEPSNYVPDLVQQSIKINSIIVLLGILGFIAGFSISLGPVMWTMFSEIFPNQLRGIAISVVGTFNTITSFLVATFFPIQIQWLGSGWTYMTYALCMVACLVFVYLYVVETKGKTLEELEEELMISDEPNL